MTNGKTNPDLRWWTITCAIAPMGVLAVMRWGLLPLVCPDVAEQLGSALGFVAAWYLFGLAIAAAVWKFRDDRRSKRRTVSAEAKAQSESCDVRRS